MIDLLYLAHNRIEYTGVSFAALLNTEGLENCRIVAYVDLDQQGTADMLRPHMREQDVLRETALGGPVAVMNDFLDKGASEVFVKIDNDLVLCPWWLNDGLKVLEQHPDIGLLGVEPLKGTPPSRENGIDLASHIGGIGFMRRAIFDDRGRPVPRGRFGFTEWQYTYKEIGRAWIDPPLHVFLLDHIPFSPWDVLSEEYIKNGWERRTWGKYGEDRSDLWQWWVDSGMPSVKH